MKPLPILDSLSLSTTAIMSAPRHEYYETDERLTLSIFDKGADPEQVSITIEARRVRPPAAVFKPTPPYTAADI